MRTAQPATYNRKAGEVMKKIMIIIAVLTALTSTSAASAWTGNTFRSPTGNIVCNYSPQGTEVNWPQVSCFVLSNRWSAELAANGLTAKGKLAPHDMRVLHSQSASAPVLGYGLRWQSPDRITCLSTLQGMRCWSASGLHGFLASAWTVKVW